MSGLLSNLPLGVGPGLGCAVYFAYGVEPQLNLSEVSWSEGIPLSELPEQPGHPVELRFAITACFMCGVILLLTSMMGLPLRLLSLVPQRYAGPSTVCPAQLLFARLN